MQQFINTGNPGGAEPIPGRYYCYYYFVAPLIQFISYLLTILDSGLIYFGQNGSNFGFIAGTSTSGSTVGFNDNATLPFEPGKTYRLRIINVSAFSAFYFWIDGHEMTIIEVDGVSSKYMSTLLLLELTFFSLCRLTLSHHL
jgi:iron transport multicopper oxidase